MYGRDLMNGDNQYDYDNTNDVEHLCHTCGGDQKIKKSESHLTENRSLKN